MPTDYMVYLSLVVTLDNPSRSRRRLEQQLAEAVAVQIPELVPDLIKDDAVNALIDRVGVERTYRKKKGAPDAER